jgi:hypothetical protein
MISEKLTHPEILKVERDGLPDGEPDPVPHCQDELCENRTSVLHQCWKCRKQFCSKCIELGFIGLESLDLCAGCRDDGLEAILKDVWNN